MANHVNIVGIILQFVALLLPLSMITLQLVFRDLAGEIDPIFFAAEKADYVWYTLGMAMSLVVGAAFAVVSLFYPMGGLFLGTAFLWLGAAMLPLLYILLKILTELNKQATKDVV